MSNPFLIYKADKKIAGEITLAGSKSISNRALIIRALSKDHFQLDRLANAKDTELLIKLLESKDELRDAGPAGTRFRFMTAYLSSKEGAQVLTGTERMKQRPIGVLAEALKKLGAKTNKELPKSLLNEAEDGNIESFVALDQQTAPRLESHMEIYKKD